MAALPDTARRKLLLLQQQANDCVVLMRASSERVRDLEGQAEQLAQIIAGTAPDPQDQLTALQQNLANTEAELKREDELMDGRQRRARSASQLVAQLTHWLAGHERTKFVVAAAPSSSKPTGDLVASLTKIRARIQSGQDALQAVRRAPASLGDLREEVGRRVAEMRARGQPRVDVLGDQLRINLDFNIRSPEAFFDLLAWLVPDTMRKRLEEALPADEPNAITSSERNQRISEIEQTILDNERTEEALIERLTASGQSVERRVAASPLALLGLEFAKKEATKTAA